MLTLLPALLALSLFGAAGEISAAMAGDAWRQPAPIRPP